MRERKGPSRPVDRTVELGLVEKSCPGGLHVDRQFERPHAKVRALSGVIAVISRTNFDEAGPMLKRLQLTRYKGFKGFSVTFGRHAILMGPNNAGKSTLINAVRLAGAAARLAMRKLPEYTYRDIDRIVWGQPIANIADSGFDFGNIAHEFESEESRIDLTLESGAVIHLVWPVDDPGFFWIEFGGSSVMTTAVARRVLDRIGIVPTLTPVEPMERRLGAAYVSGNVETKLASRHFRNQLWDLHEQGAVVFAEFLDFILANTNEITSLEVEAEFRDGQYWLNVFYKHLGSRVPKELRWAGDGLQIWLQLLFHLWRNRTSRVAILDEPDVFLHPDLQRRMVQVVEGSASQTVLASHSAEVAAESSASSLVWIDRMRRSAKRLGDDAELEMLSTQIGTVFNLSLARALRAKVALFVEGQDMKVLRVLAGTAGAPLFAKEVGLAIVPIGGFSHWPGVEAFGWVKARFLGSRVSVRVLLDRDYRSQAEVDRLLERLGEGSVSGHVWARKELESYLLSVPAIARVSGISESAAQALMAEITDSLKGGLLAQHKNHVAETLSASLRGAAFEAIEVAIDDNWQDLEYRLAVLPPKALLSGWNGVIRQHGGQIATPLKIARALRRSEIPAEMIDFLALVEAEL